MKLLYIAHELTGGDPKNFELQQKNVENYLVWCARAMDEGYSVASWVVNFETAKRGLTDYTYDKYMAIDLALLERCDELWVASDPANSNGVRLEIEHANFCHIPVREIWKE